MKSTLKKLTVLSVLAIMLVGCKKKTVEKDYFNQKSPDVAVAANGGSEESYSHYSYEQKTEVLGMLEKYAIDNNLTGLTLYENGGYVMYNTRLKKGTNTYIPGYGFGNIAEGSLTAGLDAETKPEWKGYYHDFETEDPKVINYMDDKGSVVGDLVPYVSASYWNQKMNATKDGYEWITDLAKEKPVPVNKNEFGMATKYKFEVKVGNDLKYGTLSTKSNLAPYAGRPVALEDYLTPYKTLFNQKNGLARGAENLSGASSIKGMDKFYGATANGYTDKAWENVAIKTSVSGGKSYLEIEFNNACTPFYAMYYLNSALYTPIPQSFIDEIGGVASYGKFTDSGLTPVDTFLSTGPYVLENWEKDKQIVFKKNANYADLGRYQIPGLHFQILKAQTTDTEAAFKEFLNGKLDAVAIPKTKLAEYKNDPRTTTTVGDSTFKLNLNTTNPETWEKLFGENGTVLQTPKSDYWDVEPAMYNQSFVNGLSYALNRKEYAESRGVTPSVNYFGTSYLSDPENGVSYNTTQAHKNAIANKIKDTDGFGYSLTLAKQSFKQASDQLIASGAYKKGQTIKIEIAWQTEATAQRDGVDLKKYFEDAFNNSGADLKLEVTNMATAVWSDVYYKKMLVGQYDIGVGSISGNTLNPLNFMEVLRSDNSSGFTLNWGVDTSKVSKDLNFQGKDWSYDALWQVTDSRAFISGGEIADLKTAYFNAAITESTHNEDGSRYISLKTAAYNKNDISVELKSVKYGKNFYGTQILTDADYYHKDGVLEFEIPALIEDFYYDNGGDLIIVLEFTVKFPRYENDVVVDYEEVDVVRIIQTKVKN